MAKPKADNLRSAFFGAEDSLVSTTGLVAGIGAGSQNVKFMLLAGLVGVAVEALSMGAGQYLSEKAVTELNPEVESTGKPITTGVLMFTFYIIAGLIPIAPIAILPMPWAMVAGVAAALIALFAVGYIKGIVVQRSALKSGLEVLLVGGIATAAGIAVGLLLKI